ncbi:chemotaxis protein CheW [Phenylobacterium sp.]|jgi:purine-binding chemotaxis protein CheW|uniref:chemotaxis protein CheW n=1 Tax=Phenylobacterium sp. TaxID=1871053 RepID=UPI000C8C90D5|nr:chemotaxis protein CheW [Phenylobacterium sp.]MAK82755.1 chemotaxis protein CheW [Phenylobacterium sp.]|tara:strand:- start:998 stop:1456 length:459 start_codon:yes stop_codon:yes gene_type:complete
MTGQALATSAELITVVIGEQRFAIDIQLVREIRGWTNSTPLPNAPDYVLGVINLRGAVLPVLNLAARLGLPASEARSSSVVIVVDLVGRTVGLLVDAVSDIINVGEGEIQPAPVIGAASSKGLARGMITTDEGIITLIDMSGILPAPELAAA